MSTQLDIETFIQDSEVIDSLALVSQYLEEAELAHYLGCTPEERENHILLSLANLLETLPKVAPALPWDTWNYRKKIINNIRNINYD
jgi:flagellar motor switch protein FliG